MVSKTNIPIIKPSFNRDFIRQNLGENTEFSVMLGKKLQNSCRTEKAREFRVNETPCKTTIQANKRDSVPLAGRLSFL